MEKLAEKMEASAAAHLAVPAGAHPKEHLARYRKFLKVESHRLKMQHRGGAGGRSVCEIRAGLVDILIRHLWEASRLTLSAQAQKEFPPISLVALGGYGRGELNPHSDLDIMFLHTGQVVAGSTPLPHLSKVMDGILYLLWDLNFRVGHSVRTITECVRMANSDMQSKTALLEARLIVGDGKLFEKLQETFKAKCLDGKEHEYIVARLADQAARHQKFGNSATMQEPNIKNGCGGLRDYQNLHWMAWVKYQTRSLKEMQARELITAPEHKQLAAAYDFLLSVRTELHYQVNRAVDVLTRSLQAAVALQLGYRDRSPRRRLEEFMRDLYTHSRNIYLITRTVEDRLALLPRGGALASLRNLVRVPFRQPQEQTADGFRFADGQIRFVSGRVFKEQPRRLMRVFLHAQQRGLQLHPDLAHLIRHQAELVDREFLRDEHVRETFLQVLNQRGDVSRVLRAMHDTGLLGKYLPEFGKLTCLVQHEFYHQYAADEHTLMCLEQLDRIWAATTPPLGKYAAVWQAVERPFVLTLALLLHDVGKALHTGRHSETGAQMVVRVAKRLGLDGATTHALRLLVEHHLAMAQVSQRRDLDDPGVIRSFATQVQTVENLRMLALHSVADALATSSGLWNEFKDALLWELYSKTLRLLEGGADFLRVEERQRELLHEEIHRALPRSVSPEEVDAHFHNLPPRYFQILQVKDILTDISLVHKFLHHQMAEEDKALEPVTHWQAEPDRGFTAVKVCTWDRAGLFSKIAGSFAAAGVNILSAQVFTRDDGIVLDTFFVNDAHTGSLVRGEAREQFEQILRLALTSSSVDLPALIARQRRARPMFQSLEGEHLPTRISFDNETSATHTVLDLETEDRLGLLHRVLQVLTELGLNIVLAKVSTEQGAAIDTFYLSDASGGKITSPGRQTLIDTRLRDALKSGVADP